METSIEEDYISVLSIVKGLWKKRRFLFKIVLVFFLIGAFVAIFTPNEYTSKIKFLSQTSSVSRASGKWSGIAALVGVNLNTGTDNEEIPANIYPKIINSITFQRGLMETKLNFKNIDSAITFKDYYYNYHESDIVTLAKKYTVNLPKTIVESFKGNKNRKDKSYVVTGDSLVFVDKYEQRLRAKLKQSILFSIDETDGVISIAATLPEAIPSTQLAQYAHFLLEKEIIAYRTAKAQDQMDFIEKQYQEQKVNFKTAQLNLAQYKDKNQFYITQSSQIEFQRLQSANDLAYTVFSELERQRVAQNIQLNKDTPVFTTINRAIVPLETSNQNGLKTIIVSIILGFLFAAFYGIWLEFYRKLKKTWKAIN